MFCYGFVTMREASIEVSAPIFDISLDSHNAARALRLRVAPKDVEPSRILSEVNEHLTKPHESRNLFRAISLPE